MKYVKKQKKRLISYWVTVLEAVAEAAVVIAGAKILHLPQTRYCSKYFTHSNSNSLYHEN